jgi:hypothetical protein
MLHEIWIILPSAPLPVPEHMDRREEWLRWITEVGPRMAVEEMLPMVTTPKIGSDDACVNRVESMEIREE